MSALLALTAPAGMLASLGDVDRTVLQWITTRLYTPWLDPILIHAQEKNVALPLILVLVLALALRHPRRALRTLLAGLLGVGFAMLLATVLWFAIARPRPTAVFQEYLTTRAEQADAAEHPNALVLRKSIATSPGFPSRHALTAGVFTAVFLLVSPPLGLLVALYSLLVVVGRVYGAKHWPSDVIAGLGLGLLLGWLSWRLVVPLFARVPRLGRLLGGESGRGQATTPGGERTSDPERVGP